MTSAGDPRKALERAIEAWNAGRTSDYLELYDPGVLLHGVGRGVEKVAAYTPASGARIRTHA